jgi:hypothetical protein
MSKSIDVPDSLYEKAAEVAARDNISVEELVSTLLANRLAAREFIDSRARLFNRNEFERALDRIPDGEPADSDRL